jgi:hypothetical protein
MTDLTAIPRKHSALIADAWCSHNRQLELTERITNMAKQHTAPHPPADPVTAAEQTIASLELDRRQLVSARAADDAEMAKHAYASRVLHEVESGRVLREIGERAISRDQHLRELDCAILEARDHLAAAKAAEAKEAERERAVQLRAQLKRLRMAGQAADGALAVLVGAAGEIHKATDELHRLGCPSPTGQQILSFGERAIRSAIQQTVWSRCIERLASSEKTTFGHVISQWATAIENRLGEAEQPNKERAA